jgi:hypothetical protein
MVVVTNSKAIRVLQQGALALSLGLALILGLVLITPT